MKAISLHQPWAQLVIAGLKTIETRPRRTTYRGPVVIVSTLRPYEDLPHLPLGRALGVVYVMACEPMTKRDEPAACVPHLPGRWSWHLHPRLRVAFSEPFPVRGHQGWYELDDSLPQIVAARSALHRLAETL